MLMMFETCDGLIAFFKSSIHALGFKKIPISEKAYRIGHI